MAVKSNSKTVRISDDMLRKIDEQVGETFTERFENLVRRCFFELDERQRMLRRVEQQIERKQNELRKLSAKAEFYSARLRSFEDGMERCARALDDISKK